MRMLIPLLIKYPRLVQIVDADLPRTVDDLLVAHDDAHMGDMAVFLAEESQIARLSFLQEIHQLAFLDLLRGVTWQHHSREAGTRLCQARTVDAHHGAATPEIRCAEQHLGIVQHQLGVELRGTLHRVRMWLVKRCPQAQKLAIVFDNGLVGEIRLLAFQSLVLLFADF